MLTMQPPTPGWRLRQEALPAGAVCVPGVSSCALALPPAAAPPPAGPAGGGVVVERTKTTMQEEHRTADTAGLPVRIRLGTRSACPPPQCVCATALHFAPAPPAGLVAA